MGCLREPFHHSEDGGLTSGLGKTIDIMEDLEDWYPDRPGVPGLPRPRSPTSKAAMKQVGGRMRPVLYSPPPQRNLGNMTGRT